MTSEDYWREVRSLGLQPVPGSDDDTAKHCLCSDREGHFHSVTKPERLTSEERVEQIRVLRSRVSPFDVNH